MGTTRGLERLIFFTDAVTAIAITLLILPLVDDVQAASHDGTVGDFLIANYGAILSFVLSFAVIARLWMVHHRLFESVRSYNRPLLLLSLLWAFTIVLLPLPTELLSQFRTERLTVGLYIGNMALSSAALFALFVVVDRNPDIRAEGPPAGIDQYVASLVPTLLFIVALVIGVTIPGVTYWGLLILVLTGPIERLIGRYTARIRR